MKIFFIFGFLLEGMRYFKKEDDHYKTCTYKKRETITSVTRISENKNLKTEAKGE